jgi:hypothetical protein
MLRFLLVCLLVLGGCSSAEERFDGELKRCVTKNNSFQDSGFFDALDHFEKYLIARNVLEDRSREAYRSLISRVDSSAALPSYSGFCSSYKKCDQLVYPASAVTYPTCLAGDAQIDVEVSPQTIRGRLQLAAENARERADIGSAYLQALHEPMTRGMFEQILYRGALLQPVATQMHNVESDDSTGTQSDA